MKLGIIGCGYVGKAVRNAFAPYHEMRCYDVVPERSTHSIDEVRECDVIFVCVPTPSAPDGSCDLRCVWDAIEPLSGTKAAVVLKSTVPPGTTAELCWKYNIERVMFWPEFLNQRTADADFECPQKIVVGHDDQEDRFFYRIRRLIRDRWPGVPYIETDCETAEFAKYLCNAFYTVKVSFFNEMRTLSDVIDVDWQDALRIALADGRISPSHTQVPGPGGLGFGGACLPKDIAALIKIAESVGVEPHVLKGAVERNRIQRGKA